MAVVTTFGPPLKKEPAYKEAIDKILMRFDEGGYGIIITDTEMDSYLSLVPVNDESRASDLRKYQLARLQAYKAIDALLCDHSICLVRSKAVEGFELLHPRDQIKVSYERRMVKMRQQLNRAAMALNNINAGLLSIEEESDRQRKMIKSAFVRMAVNKRKIELPPAEELKKLGS